MTSNIDAMIKRAETALQRAAPLQPKPVTYLPMVFLDDQGQPLPGYADIERRALASGVNVKYYQGLDPDEDGTEV